MAAQQRDIILPQQRAVGGDGKPHIEAEPRALGTRIGHGIVDERAAVFQLSTTGRTGEGSDFELFFNLAYLVDDGAITHLEFFPDDELDAATARLRSIMESGPLPTS